MQDLVGIVRTEDEMLRALDGLEALKGRAAKVGVRGNREYNPGWHTAIDLNNLLLVAEAVTRCAIERKESRGGHFRDDFPAKDEAYAGFNLIVRKGDDGQMVLSRRPLPPMPAELLQIIEENK
ncbi:MAG TPA: fumarate reductase/succinate dehydrogenase flavoprotein subunit, partial [Myxococcota bacterium]|nr:fumarate reductase/succinate dehydrogenase flavoprotein subunit [Myxococcota bacterium]